MSHVDAGDADFDARVIERSRQVPVLVDFWAPWCGPCRTLGPVLDEVVGERAGSVELVKVNTDQAQGVAARYGIRSIPDVRLFSGGELVSGFVGALPAPRVRAFLDEHLPDSPARKAAAGAEDALYRRDFARAVELARQVPASSKDADRMEAIAALAERMQATRASDDAVAARHAHALEKVLERDHRAALELLLGIVEKHRKWGDDAGRKTMLEVFQLIGQRSELSDEYRRKLSFLI